MTTRDANCNDCGAAIDWTGKDQRRAPGLLEDGGTFCRDCAYESQRQYEPRSYAPPVDFSRQPGPDEGPHFDD
jgi:hypothetical protein